MSFQSFELSKPIFKAISELGFIKPTEIQQSSIPILLKHNGDFVGQAQTGTGKTAAFIIPLLERMDYSSDNVQALILTPTRELACQVLEEVNKFAKYLPCQAMSVYGGTSYSKQISALKHQKPQIVVGTPGRIIDLINRKVLKLKSCKNFIIDEADEMFNMGFIDDVYTIVDSLKSSHTKWMFSATMSNPIMKLIEKKFSKPKVIKVAKKTLTNGDIDQFYCTLMKKNFAKALHRFVESVDDCYGIVFCETRLETRELSEKLQEQGLSVSCLHGDLNQAQRDQAMNKFKSRKVDLLVCTDVASRGIDVSSITHVFNMGLPRQSEVYVHRIGRTGRVGLKGQSISFITPGENIKKKQIEVLTGQKLQTLNLPKPRQLKEIKVRRELNKMDGIKTAVVGKDREFKIDPSFEQFAEYFQDLSKEQILKLLFSYNFNREIRQIDEGPCLEKIDLKIKMKKPYSRRRRFC